MLVGRAGKKVDLVVRGARVLDPGEGIDAMLDVRVDSGVIVELGTTVPANGHAVVDGEGNIVGRFSDGREPD